MNNINIEPTPKGYYVKVTPGSGYEFEQPTEVIEFVEPLLEKGTAKAGLDTDEESEEWNHT